MYGGTDPKQTLDDAAKATDRAIDIANRTNGKK